MSVAAELLDAGCTCADCGVTLEHPTGFPTVCEGCQEADQTRPFQLLALDVASTTGWARAVEGEELTSGVVKLRCRTRNKVREPRGAKFSQLQAWLDEQEIPDQIAIERAGRFKSAAAAETIHGLLAIAEAWAYDHAIPLEYLSPGTIKKHATGKGNADKAAMIAAARERWPGVKLADDNEADARHIADCYLARA